LAANTLIDRILARLLKAKVRHKLLDAYPNGHTDERLEDVDVLLLSLYLDADVRGAFLNAMKSAPEAG
jgi:hypothetical protein